jgi:hypothetical protein
MNPTKKEMAKICDNIKSKNNFWIGLLLTVAALTFPPHLFIYLSNPFNVRDYLALFITLILILGITIRIIYLNLFALIKHEKLVEQSCLSTPVILCFSATGISVAWTLHIIANQYLAFMAEMGAQ